MKLDSYDRLLRMFGGETISELVSRGMTEDELAEKFGVTRLTLRRWRKQYPKFDEALRLSSSGADFDVISAIFKRAVGYTVTVPKTYKLKRVEYDPVTGKKLREYEELAVKEESEYVPGDLRASEFWLRARQGENWGERGSSAGDAELGIVELPLALEKEES